MARRTTSEKVERLLGGNYGSFNGVTSDLGQWIDQAKLLVDQVAALQAKKVTPVTLDSDNYEMMERCLAAYLYTLNDPLHTNESTEGASGGYVAEKLDPNRYKTMAVMSDPTGVLNALLNRTIATTVWLGKTKTEQIDYDDR